MKGVLLFGIFVLTILNFLVMINHERKIDKLNRDMSEMSAYVYDTRKELESYERQLDQFVYTYDLNWKNME
jgi:predicted RNase H-like nuclease (RuvC/YqgF family)